eukprot:59276-Prymnesium_polylepis.1
MSVFSVAFVWAKADTNRAPRALVAHRAPSRRVARLRVGDGTGGETIGFFLFVGMKVSPLTFSLTIS